MSQVRTAVRNKVISIGFTSMVANRLDDIVQERSVIETKIEKNLSNSQVKFKRSGDYAWNLPEKF